MIPKRLSPVDSDPFSSRPRCRTVGVFALILVLGLAVAPPALVIPPRDAGAEVSEGVWMDPDGSPVCLAEGVWMDPDGLSSLQA